MAQEDFYREKRKDRKGQTLRLTERLGADWKIRPMSQRENEEIWRKCGGDAERYEREFLAESVCFPNLKDAALQNSYHAVGAERLLERLLLAGEYDCLRQAVEKINGGEAEECIDSI